MTFRRERDRINVQLLENEKLEALAAGHPLMATAWKKKKDELQARLATLPLGKHEPRAVILFSGEPVVGSIGIDANFAGRVLIPFQSMVMADYANRWHGKVGKRGPRTGENESRLLLTALPHGSFGLELTKAESTELFEEEQLADSLAHLTRLVGSATKSDADFASELDGTAPRVLQNLRDFLEVISKGSAGFQLESGDARLTVTPSEAQEAYQRVADTLTNDETLFMEGRFGGALLNSWRFDFIDSAGYKISGVLDDNITQEQVEGMDRNFINKPCLAKITKTTVTFKNGATRTTYTLQEILPSKY
jgi:hypothetical protein